VGEEVGFPSINPNKKPATILTGYPLSVISEGIL